MHILIFISRHGIKPIKRDIEPQTTQQPWVIEASHTRHNRGGVTAELTPSLCQGMEAGVVWWSLTGRAGPGSLVTGQSLSRAVLIMQAVPLEAEGDA